MDEERKKIVNEFSTKYTELTYFLAMFVEMSYNKKLIAAKLARDYGIEWAGDNSALLEQGKEVISLTPFPLAELISYTNRYFKNEEQGRQWLTRMLKEVEDADQIMRVEAADSRRTQRTS